VTVEGHIGQRIAAGGSNPERASTPLEVPSPLSEVEAHKQRRKDIVDEPICQQAFLKSVQGDHR
jgi:hypothetical protein